MVHLDAKFEVNVRELSWSGKLSDIVRVDMNNLNGELARQPGLVSWFGVVQVEAVDEVEALKNKVSALKEDQDSLYADLDLLMRQESAGGKKPTEAEIKSMVTANDKYKAKTKEIQDKREELRVASGVLGQLKAVLIALEHKRDMLVQLSANHRKEFISGNYEEKA